MKAVPLDREAPDGVEASAVERGLPHSGKESVGQDIGTRGTYIPDAEVEDLLKCRVAVTVQVAIED